MTGNVWQWCNDRYGAYTAGAETDPTGASSGTYRVLRGGSWYGIGVVNVVDFCSAYRNGSVFIFPVYSYYIIGFRVVLPQ